MQIYANQIQALTLANAELHEHNRRLREQLETANPRSHAWPTTAELACRPGTAPADWTP